MSDREKEIKETIDDLQSELKDIQDKRKNLTPLDEFSNEKKMKVFNYLYDSTKEIAEECIEKRVMISDEAYHAFLESSLKLFFGDDIIERLDYIINEEIVEG